MVTRGGAGGLPWMGDGVRDHTGTGDTVGDLTGTGDTVEDFSGIPLSWELKCWRLGGNSAETVEAAVTLAGTLAIVELAAVDVKLDTVDSVELGTNNVGTLSLAVLGNIIDMEELVVLEVGVLSDAGILV